MNILILLLIPALFALSNTVDKFLVHGDDVDSEPGSLIAVTGFFSLVVAAAFGCYMAYRHEAVNFILLLPLVANGGIWIVALWMYLAVLRTDDTSRAIPWFQTIPFFGIAFGHLALRETPSAFQVLGIALVIVGGFVLSLKNGKMNRKTVVLMIASSGLIALYDVIFAKFGRELGDHPAILGSLLGDAFWGSIFLVGARERRGFILGLRTKLGLQAVTEALTLAAAILMNFAKLHVKVALVQAGCATQPLFVLVFAIILSKSHPHVFSEEMNGQAIWKKTMCIAVVVIGGAILSYTTA